VDKISIFDFEQQLMECTNVIEDIDMITSHFINDTEWAGKHFSAHASDALMNKYGGVKELYELKFRRMLHTFEKVCNEYHGYRKQVENLGQQK